MNEKVLVEVKLWGQSVAYLHWLKDRQLAQFEYTESFIQSGLSPSPITMPTEKGVFEFPQLARSDTFLGLPGLIADSLPDRFGNALIDVYLQKTNRDLLTVTPTERLLYMGSRGMGALEFEPALKQQLSLNEQINFDQLVKLAGNVLQQRAGMHSDLSHQEG